MKKILFILAIPVLAAAAAASGQSFRYIAVGSHAHPAIEAAARMIAQKLGIPLSHILHKESITVPGAGVLALTCGTPSAAQLKFLGRDPRKVEFDGYLIRFRGNSALVFGKRPRSLLYAAGDLIHWKNRREGLYVRQPDFRIRDVNKGSAQDLDHLVAETGCNIIFDNIHPGFITLQKSFPRIFDSIPADRRQQLLMRERQAEGQGAQLAKACHDADVDFYPFLYGNDIVRWNPVLAAAVYKAYPGIEGVRAPHSWEKATLNPSLSITWNIIDSLVAEYMRVLQGDGLIVTFWDDYGLYSQDSLSRLDGMNLFGNELAKIVSEYAGVLARDHKPLIVRTWSSGRAHWVTLFNNAHQREHQFVHAPGYGGFSGTRLDVWGKVIDSTPAPVMLQTKSYMSDCFPAARNNTLIGRAKDHPQILEYQMTGQTTGLFYLPAANVEYTDSTMSRGLKLIGKNGGTSVFYGGTHQPGYDLFSDIANGIDIYAWKELSWNVHADIRQIWKDWATPIYGQKAAPDIISALRLSEPVVNKIFSTLGFGWDTNSGFPGTIYRREVLLMYTNRFYLPRYRKYLIPDTANIRLVLHEKNSALREIDSMFLFLDMARPFLKKDQYAELHTRFTWLKYVAIENKALEVSYWRFRYLRYLYSLRTTDTLQMKAIASSLKRVRYYRDSLFRYDPAQQFSCYDMPLGQVSRRRHISLGNPMRLMQEIYDTSRYYVREITGPLSGPEAETAVHPKNQF